MIGKQIDCAKQVNGAWRDGSFTLMCVGGFTTFSLSVHQLPMRCVYFRLRSKRTFIAILPVQRVSSQCFYSRESPDATDPMYVTRGPDKKKRRIGRLVPLI